MKKALFILLIALSNTSCKKEEKPNQPEKTVVADTNSELYGNWVGNFTVTESDSLAEADDYVYSNKLNLVIKKIDHYKAYGQSIVAGNSRPLIGNFSEYNGEYRFMMKEPGGKKNDGQFVFKIINDTLVGTWTANNKKSTVRERRYELTKQPFKYDPQLMLPKDDDYVDWYSVKIDSAKYEINGVEDTEYSEVYRVASNIITQLNASTTLLTESDLKNLKKLELEIIRNTIFARHGYTFKKRSFRQFFDPVAWYIPVTDDMSGKLTAVEQKNIVLLNRFQKYAEDNYDSFGR